MGISESKAPAGYPDTLMCPMRARWKGGCRELAVSHEQDGVETPDQRITRSAVNNAIDFPS
jgi:hypothetical protein